MEDKNKKVIETYDAIAERYAETFDKKLGDKTFLDVFLSYLKEGDRVIDLGSGTGQHAKYFSDHGLIVEGIELSSEMLRIAQAQYPGIPFRQVDIRLMNYPKDSMDGIWAVYSLFHFKREVFLDVIKKIKKILKPGGIFGLVMQEGEGEVEIADPILPTEKMYIHLYSQEELMDILIDNGFKIVRQDEKEPQSKNEFPYRKLFFTARLV